jgi:hypothetical protein
LLAVAVAVEVVGAVAVVVLVDLEPRQVLR